MMTSLLWVNYGHAAPGSLDSSISIRTFQKDPLTSFPDVPSGKRPRTARVVLHLFGRGVLKREKFDRLRFAAQQVLPDAPGDNVGRHHAALKQRLRDQQGVASGTASLLDPRRRVHRIAEKSYLPLESADLSGNKWTRVQAGTKCWNMFMSLQEI
jgi:hypothetical protein